MPLHLSMRRANGTPDVVSGVSDRLEERRLTALHGLLPRALIREGLVLDQHIREGRFQRSLALIAGLSSALSGIEVLTEHYRGSYSQRVMYSPIILSPALLIAGVWGAVSRRAARTVLPLVSLLTVADGLVGFAFHVRGVARKPGGWRVPIFNVIMGPPVFAPLLFAISGYLGLIATFLRREGDTAPPVPEALIGRIGRIGRIGPKYRLHLPLVDAQVPADTGVGWLRFVPRGLRQRELAREQNIAHGRFQKHLAAAAAISAVFSGVEALYSHYKNNFRYKAQWSPILLTPMLFVAGIGAIPSKRIARTLLPFVSILAMLDGVVGTFYHLRGMVRRPGGLRYPLYNLMYGPPVFAPLLFAASGFLGLLASLLRRAD